jgi:hypothetical protein
MVNIVEDLSKTNNNPNGLFGAPSGTPTAKRIADLSA